MIEADAARAPSLSIISVAYPNDRLLQANLDLTRRLNPQHRSRWIVVDNTPDGGLRLRGADHIDILPGAARDSAHDRGSMHHAAGLQKALKEVRSRFVLFLDHDFYVVRAEWIATLLAHVHSRGIAFFGSAWHPRWFYQYREFPSVHFMLVDLERVPRETIDTTPAIAGDRWWRFINDDSKPLPGLVRDTLKAARIRDTGWRLHRRYHNDPAVRTETLLPHWVPPEEARYPWERRLSRLLPDSWLKYPATPSSYTEESFLRARWPDAYRLGWEEHFWQGKPFAVHLRGVGRAMHGRPAATEGVVLQSFVADVIAARGIQPR